MTSTEFAVQKGYFRSFPSGKIIKHSWAEMAFGLQETIPRDRCRCWTGIINNRDNLLKTILGLMNQSMVEGTILQSHSSYVILSLVPSFFPSSRFIVFEYKNI